MNQRIAIVGFGTSKRLLAVSLVRVQAIGYSLMAGGAACLARLHVFMCRTCENFQEHDTRGRDFFFFLIFSSFMEGLHCDIVVIEIITWERAGAGAGGRYP